MKKGIRATYIAARMINNRPDYESCEAFCKRIGLPCTHTVESMMNRKDVSTGILYRLCKALGYQIIVYNPKPPVGMNSMYIVGTGKSPIAARELKGKCHITRDVYTGEVYRVVRKYKRKKKSKKFIKVG